MVSESVSCVELNVTEIFGSRQDDWSGERLERGLVRLVHECSGTELVRLRGRLPVWVLCAAAVVLEPSVLELEAEDRVGRHRLVCTPFPIDAGGSDTGVEIETHELGNQVLASVRCDPSRFDYLRFDDIVVPPVSPGLNVAVCGTVPVPVAVSLVLSYAREADSVWLCGSEEDVCVVSRRPGCQVGDRLRHKIQ